MKFLLPGVATFLLAVNWSESITLSISSKFLPVVAGYMLDSLRLLSGQMTKSDLQATGRPALYFSSGSIMP